MRKPKISFGHIALEYIQIPYEDRFLKISFVGTEINIKGYQFHSLMERILVFYKKVKDYDSYLDKTNK